MSLSLRPLRVNATPESILHIHSLFMRSLAKPTPLNAFTPGCVDACGECAQCAASKARVAALLTHPASHVFEAIDASTIEPEGILLLSRVDPGRDATACYTFFDGKLRDKTELVQAWIDWAFQTFSLQRLTIEVPGYAFAALRHAKKLGFGGAFVYESFKVEGVKRAALDHANKPADLILMGMTRDDGN